jgi:hypothetical protein
MTQLLLTEKEVAALLRVGRSKVKNFLPRVRLSAQGVRYDIRDVEALIESKKENTHGTN